MKRLLFSLYLVSLSAGLASAQDPSIAERLAAEIRAVLPGASVAVPDPLGLDITFAGQTRSVGIGSVHTTCAQDAAKCQEAIRDYAQRAASYMLETVPLSRDQPRIVVRSRSYLDSMAAQMGSTQGFVDEPLVGDLMSVCCRDLANGRRPVLPTDLPNVQLDRTSAIIACRINSQNQLAPLATLWNALPKQGIGVIRTGDDVTGYFAVPADWQSLAQQLGGLIVAVPSIDTALYARGSDAADLDAISTLARQMHAEASVPVSPQIFRWTDHGWVAVQR